jgi:p-aminobenzoyl-glutamate transporter AbgT
VITVSDSDDKVLVTIIVVVVILAIIYGIVTGDWDTVFQVLGAMAEAMADLD